MIVKLCWACSFFASKLKAATAWKVSKYGVISGPYLPVFNPNTGEYGPEITPYLDTFHAVMLIKHSLTTSQRIKTVNCQRWSSNIFRLLSHETAHIQFPKKICWYISNDLEAFVLQNRIFQLCYGGISLPICFKGVNMH